MDVRLVSWNVLEGFHRPAAEDPARPLDGGRLAAAREVLSELRPDVLVLNEALWCREHGGRFVDYAGLLGFGFQVADTYDGEWGNVVLSRLPVVGQGRFRIHNRGGVTATVDAGGWTLTVATYHPHPSRWPHNKASDFAALAGGSEGPLAVCGDFNAVSPEDRVDRDALVAAFSRFSRRPEHDLDRFLEGGRAVFAATSALGLRDAVPLDGRRYTIPTDLASPHKDSGMRIDHVLVNAMVGVKWGEVVRHPAAERASDHYPVVVDLRPAAAEAAA